MPVDGRGRCVNLRSAAARRGDVRRVRRAPLTRTTSASVTGSTSSPACICSGAASTSFSTSRSCTGGTRAIAAIRPRSGSRTGASRGTRPARSATAGGDATTTSPFAWVFLINGLVYVVWNLYSTHFRNRMWPARDEWTLAHVRTELRDHLRWRSRRHAPNGSYGTLQKTSYLILIFVFVPLMILTGIAQSPGFTAAMPALLDLFGGRQSARTLHTIGTVALVLFVVVHVVEVAAAGFFVKVRSMITGK